MRAISSLCRSISFLSLPAIVAVLFAGIAQGQTTDTPANPAAASPAAPPTANPPDQAPSNSLDIDYTGSLMGYYRMEYGEDPNNPVLPPVQSFLKTRTANSKTLLLGMGDNFGPEFGASLQLDGAAPCDQAPKETPSGEGRPESLYKDDDRVPNEAQCDNVLNFFMHAGFRAVVPGSQDFMYTARWLREAALLVSQVSHSDPKTAPAQVAISAECKNVIPGQSKQEEVDTCAHEKLVQQRKVDAPAEKRLINNSENQLYMLAANLRISMKSKNAAEDATSGNSGGDSAAGANTGNGPCPLLFSKNPFAEGTFRCQSAEPAPFDWLNRLDRLSTSNTTLTAMRELATGASLSGAGRAATRNALVSDEVAILQAAWGSPQAWASEDDAKKYKLPEFRGKFGSGTRASGSPDLNQDSMASVQDGLSKLPACPNGKFDENASFADPIDKANAQDLCIYAARMQEILKTTGEALIDPGKPNPAPCAVDQPVGQPKPAPTVGACFLLTEAARLAAIRGLLRTIALEEKDVGYTVADSGDGGKVLIVGVIGVDTMKAVSETNLELCIAGKPGQTAKDKSGNSQQEFDTCGDRRKAGKSSGSAQDVLVADPVEATETLVRGAALLEDKPFERVVVMAQMPHTEAEILSERVWAQLKLAKATEQVDVVLSEVESGYGTPRLSLNYKEQSKNSTQAAHPPAVVTPDTSYSSETGSYPGAVSLLTLSTASGKEFSLANQRDANFQIPSVSQSENTISLLYELVEGLKNKSTPQPNLSSTVQATSSALTTLELDPEFKQKAEFALLRDLQKSLKTGKPDLVLLQSRDVELDAIGKGFTDYSMCDGEKTDPTKNGRTPEQNYELCELRSALDRIFWKGDYLEFVAVTGKDLENMLALSESTEAEQAQLAEAGPTGQWLISFGIVQSTLSNLTEVSQNDEPLWIPVDPHCKGAQGPKSTYCVDGTPIREDSYYWLLTTDQLAQDKAIYGTLQALPSDMHKVTETFVSNPLSHFLQDNLNIAPASQPSLALALYEQPDTKKPVETVIGANNVQFQQRDLYQIDFAKVIASFSSREAVGGNQYVSLFQGVSDARATAPNQQSLDLEMASRVLLNLAGSEAGKSWPPPLSIGEQSAFSYDRAVIGNLTGKPINATYPLNNLTEGAFLQVRLGRAVDKVPSVQTLPRSLLVLTPHQYQLGIDTPYLFLTYSTGQVPTGELTVQLPRISAWTDRAGFREEFGTSHSKVVARYLPMVGSYIETGMEFGIQSGNLSALTLQTGSKQKTCPFLPNVTLQTCFGNASYGSPGIVLTLNDTTTVVGRPAVETLHTPGYYWDLHLQYHVYGKEKSQINVVTDSQGDYYFGRPPAAELPTQTEYAMPLNVSLVLPSLGNLSFAPTYSGFFFKPQLSNQNLVINTFSISARWYFARDARVPVPKQAPLPGPASANQTVTGKSH